MMRDLCALYLKQGAVFYPKRFENFMIMRIRLLTKQQVYDIMGEVPKAIYF